MILKPNSGKEICLYDEVSSITEVDGILSITITEPADSKIYLINTEKKLKMLTNFRIIPLKHIPAINFGAFRHGRVHVFTFKPTLSQRILTN